MRSSTLALVYSTVVDVLTRLVASPTFMPTYFLIRIFIVTVTRACIIREGEVRTVTTIINHRDVSEQSWEN